MTTVSEMRATRGTKIKEAREILDIAKKAHRELDEEESAKWEALVAEADEIQSKIDNPEGVRSRFAPEPGGGSRERREGMQLAPDEKLSELRGGQGLPDGIQTRELSFGRFIRGLTTGDWRGAAAEQRVLGEAAAGTGGVFVPTPLSAQVIDLARAQSQVVRAGARTVPMEHETLTVARIASDPTPGWKAENAEGVISDPTFDSVVFTARTLFCGVQVSQELIEDAPNAESAIERTLAEALGQELDRVALRGTGTAPEPEGVLNQTGIQTTALAGALVNHNPFSVAVEELQGANYMPNAAIMHPKLAGVIDRFTSVDGQPRLGPPSFQALAKFTTSKIPTDLGGGSDETEAYIGEWPNLWIGVRERLRLEASIHAADGTSGAFRNLQVWIRAWLRADVQLARPSFHVLTGVQV